MILDLPSVAFEYVFVCDDVRFESNGKLIFVGVYSNNILLGEFPGVLRLRLVTRLRPKKREFPLAFRVKRNGEAVFVLKGSVVSGDLAAETSPSPEFAIELREPGLLEFEVCDSAFEIEAANAAPWVPLYNIAVEAKRDG